MKKILHFLFVLILLDLTSCKKFLDTKQTDALSPENYYNSEKELTSSLAGVYDILGLTYGSFFLYRYGVDGDEGHYGTGATTGPEAYNVTSGDQFYSAFWKNLYDGINRANVLMANVDKNPSINQAVRDQVRGEALFLRSYYYFLLVQTYGGVPLILKPVTSANDVDIAKSPAKEVYERVLTDMKMSEALVAKINVLGYGGRASKSAIRGILARVCLNMAGEPVNDKSKFAEALAWSKLVIADTEAAHALNSEYSQVFINYAQDKYDIKESIWEVEYFGVPGSVYSETGQNAAVNGPVCTNTETGVCNGTMRANTNLYNLYEPGDQRRDWVINNFTYNATGPKGSKTFIATATPATIYTRYSAKYRREYENSLPNPNYASSQNYPLLRFSDVLLMFAEAEYELNGASADAIDAINQVRRRAWSTGIKAVTVTSGGTGYSTAPTVSFTDGGGSGAIATATVSGGRVTGVVLSPDEVTGFKNGKSYVTAPVVSFSGGGGSGAVAGATIFSKNDANLTPSQITNFKTVIQDERSRELCFEGLRRADLIRTGKFVSTMNSVGGMILQYVPTALYAQRYFNVKDKHVLWPIPARDISLNRALIQNPEW